MSDVKDALCFSDQLTPPGTPHGPYNWHPLDWAENEIDAPSAEFVQDPKTLILNEACKVVLAGRVRRGSLCRKPAEDLPMRTWNWMSSRGFVISDTGGVPNHPPFEIQYDQDVERDTERQTVLAERAQVEILQAYREAGGSGTDVGDTQYMWLVAHGALAGDPQPTKILSWLRVHSAVEYCATLGADVYGNWSERPKFGATELLLVATLLGGPPL